MTAAHLKKKTIGQRRHKFYFIIFFNFRNYKLDVLKGHGIKTKKEDTVLHISKSDAIILCKLK